MSNQNKITNVKVYICLNCKLYWIGVRSQCSCGGKSFQETDCSNKDFAENRIEDGVQRVTEKPQTSFTPEQLQELKSMFSVRIKRRREPMFNLIETKVELLVNNQVISSDSVLNDPE